LVTAKVSFHIGASDQGKVEGITTFSLGSKSLESYKE